MQVDAPGHAPERLPKRMHGRPEIVSAAQAEQGPDRKPIALLAGECRRATDYNSIVARDFIDQTVANSGHASFEQAPIADVHCCMMPFCVCLSKAKIFLHLHNRSLPEVLRDGRDQKKIAGLPSGAVRNVTEFSYFAWKLQRYLVFVSILGVICT